MVDIKFSGHEEKPSSSWKAIKGYVSIKDRLNTLFIRLQPDG